MCEQSFRDGTSIDQYSLFFFYSRERNETTEANRLCTECKRDFCEQCAQRHSSVPAFKQHSIIAMPTGNMASLRYCGSHSDELLMYNCLTCDQFVCSLCITDTHNTCEVHSVSEVSTHIRPFAKDLEALFKLSGQVNYKSTCLHTKPLVCSIFYL